MIYFCADDYGISVCASEHIQQCVDEGALNKVSVFPNLDAIDLKKISGDKKIMLSLHLNLVEGKCMADAGEISLIADSDGNLKHTFGGLFRLNLLRGKELEEAVYKEVKAQVLFWKNALPEGSGFCVDGHQHTHMIPAVFRALIRVLDEEKIELEYMRIPDEPILPYLRAPSLYLTYSPVNIIKQWLLKALWAHNKKYAAHRKIPTACFMGILFSGKMDEKRVGKVLSEYIKMAKKSGSDIEVLFHPGYIDAEKADLKNENITFEKFYLSKNRKTEFDSIMNMSVRGVL